jgi:hypothetical protein
MAEHEKRERGKKKRRGDGKEETMYERYIERKKNERKNNSDRSKKKMKEKKGRGREVNKQQPNSLSARDILEKLIAATLTKNKIKINGKNKEMKVEKEK